MALFAQECPDAQGRSAPAARELVKIIVLVFLFCMDGSTILVSSVGALTLISICFHHSPASVIWKGINVFVPALFIKISMSPSLVETYLSISNDSRISDNWTTPLQPNTLSRLVCLQISRIIPITFTSGKYFERSSLDSSTWLLIPSRYCNGCPRFCKSKCDMSSNTPTATRDQCHLSIQRLSELLGVNWRIDANSLGELWFWHSCGKDGDILHTSVDSRTRS